MPKQSNHNKKTHDSLVDRVAKELRARYNYKVRTNVEYEEGELDIARYDKHGNIITYYEVKSNHQANNFEKAYKQTKRFINYKKGTIDIMKMKQQVRGVYISQDEIGGEIKAEKLV